MQAMSNYMSLHFGKIQVLQAAPNILYKKMQYPKNMLANYS